MWAPRNLRLPPGLSECSLRRSRPELAEDGGFDRTGRSAHEFAVLMQPLDDPLRVDAEFFGDLVHANHLDQLPTVGRTDGIAHRRATVA